ncbi:MAG: hypothetical protein KIT58_14220 [Planctomycetota bacterium]|nr:hypothetical protein [Planctomycetota bacterium]
MQIHNHLPLLLDCLRRWEARPSLAAFEAEYVAPLSRWLSSTFIDSRRLYLALADLNWPAYRAEALALDPAREEARLRRRLADVEALFGAPLGGQALLFGAFTCMDGYARFDRGDHTVFLGVDESHGRGAYLDVLIAHELTHVVRESRPEVWAGWGLSLDMTNHEFTERLPVVEHLVNEGFSCVVSELLVPGEDRWHYAYQSEDDLARIVNHGPAVDAVVHAELRHPDGDYGRLYSPSRYGRSMPMFTHYVWAWQWVKRLLRTHAGGDPRRLVARCSKDLVDDALSFRLERLE